MHFTVMVIGDNPEDQLGPYYEGNQSDPYPNRIVSDNDKRRFVEYYTIKKAKENGKTGTPTEADPYGEENWEDNNENFDEVFEEFYKEYGKEWNDNCWEKNDDGEWEEWSTYNPNSKWDWYSLGGRWSGLIKLKPGAKGKKGRPGVFENKIGIDQALKGDIENINEIKTFAVLKYGEWYEGDDAWGVQNKEKENDWDEKISELLKNVSDDTLISIYDCHI
jgi:hypothetical protein